jgi:serine/threonine protein kinase
MSTGSGAVFQPLETDDPAAVGNYRLAARLGSGGMGKVYLSYTPAGRPVAVKVIRPEFAEDPEFRRRFRQEVQAAQRVHGLCTAPVIDSDAEGARPWLATAFVQGPTLSSAVAEHGPLPVPTVLLLVAGIAEALQAVHAAGLVHRDLKPSNVLLAADGPRVIDFGIARAADSTALTDSGVTVGTPAFMSPEQAAGREITWASDVFALGQVAAYAALGSPAYGDGPSHAVLYRIVHEEPDLSALPAQLRPLVTACLDKDPARRPLLPQIVEMCQAASDQTQLRRPEQWLPGAVAADIPERHALPAYTPTAANPPAPPHPLTQPDGPPPVQPTATPYVPPPAQGPYAYQPTQTAATVGSGPVPPPLPGAPAYHHRAPGSGNPYQSPVLGQRPKRRGFVVVASVIGALLVIGGVGAALNALNGDGKKDSTNSSSGGPSSTGGTSSSPSTSAPKPEVHHNVQLPSGYHLEFADEALKPVTNNLDDFYYLCDFSGCSFGSYNTELVLLDQGQNGSLATCLSDNRITHLIEKARLSVGSQVCARTTTGVVALLTYKKGASASDASQYVVFDVTLWRNAIPAK